MKRKKRKVKKTKERSETERERGWEGGGVEERKREGNATARESEGRRGGKKSEEDRCVVPGAAKRERNSRATVSAGGGNLATWAAH